MKKILFVLISGLLISESVAYADDVSIDGSGNMTTGISNTNANLEVTGDGEDAIYGSADGSSAPGVVGVYGEYWLNGQTMSYGILGHELYGVFGASLNNNDAGYFQGPVRITGSLTLDGALIGGGHDHAGADITSGVVAAARIAGPIARDTEIVPTMLANDGPGSTLDADLLDGNDSSAFATAVHGHAGADITIGVVAAARIAGPIARDSEIMPAVLANDGSGSTVDADMLDGIDSAGFAASSHIHSGSLYGKVAIVAQSGGDYTSPLDAMNDLAAWCGTLGSTNPCLVRIMPGIYDLGNNGLAMRAYVDIEGSGENTTTITSIHSSGTSATVTGADNAEIRFLTVENQGGSTVSIAIYNDNASPDITNVTAIASGGSSINDGVRNYSSSPKMTNVIASAAGGTNNRGVVNSISSPAMTHVTATASGGTDNYGVSNFGSPSTELVDVSSNGIIITGHQLFVPASGSDTDNGTLLLAVSNEIIGLGAPSAANHYTIKLDAGSYNLGNNGLAMQSYVDIEGSGENTTTITSTHSSGTPSTSASVSGADNAEIRFLTVKNYGGSTFSIAIYNDSASPDMTNATATASGGSDFNYGVRNDNSSSPTMTNVTATASGGISSRGVYNQSSSPEMTNITAVASGGSGSNYGVYNDFSSPEMTNVTATASGGSDFNYGVRNNDSSPTIITSSISGTTKSIFNNFASTVKVAATMLDGSVTGGVFTCVGAYDKTFTALGTDCL